MIFLLFLLDSPDWPLPFYISSPLGSVWSSPPEDTVFPSTLDILILPPPAIVSTAAASSSSSQTSTPAASSVPQPMDLDCTHPMKRDPHHGLCFNCGKPGHIVKVCQGPHTQNVRNVNAMMTLRLAPEDLQFLMESIRAMIAPSAPMMPLSQLAMGCVTCHTCHGCVTDFRPILGNPMEVTHVTSLGLVYSFPC